MDLDSESDQNDQFFDAPEEHQSRPVKACADRIIKYFIGTLRQVL